MCGQLGLQYNSVFGQWPTLIIPAPSQAEGAGLKVQGEPGLQSETLPLKQGGAVGGIRSLKMPPSEEINVVLKRCSSREKWSCVCSDQTTRPPAMLWQPEGCPQS